MKISQSPHSGNEVKDAGSASTVDQANETPAFTSRDPAKIAAEINARLEAGTLYPHFDPTAEELMATLCLNDWPVEYKGEALVVNYSAKSFSGSDASQRAYWCTMDIVRDGLYHLGVDAKSIPIQLREMEPPERNVDFTISTPEQGPGADEVVQWTSGVDVLET